VETKKKLPSCTLYFLDEISEKVWHLTATNSQNFYIEFQLNEILPSCYALAAFFVKQQGYHFLVPVK
jgi:hypothetical protein